MRRKYLVQSCLLFVAALAFTDAPAQKTKDKRPNIIFILADDQGFGDLGTFFQNQRASLKDPAKPVEISPNLDKLAKEGTILSQYYCAAPICAPSRASLLLGVSQGHSNVRDNQFDKALDDNYTIASTLRQLGYSTAAIGKWGLQGNDKYDLNGYLWPAHPLKRGFQYYFGYMRHSDGHEHYPKEALYRKYWAENAKEVWQNYTIMTPKLDKCYTADLWTAAAKKYIIDHTHGKENNNPFFLYLAFDTPHAVLELPASPYPQGGGLKGGIQWIGKPGHFINTATGTPDSYLYPEYAHATYDDDDDPTTPAVPWPETYKRYATANRRIDDAVGDLMQLLADLKIDRNTIVVYTSDNGPSKESYLPEDKYPPNKPTFFSSYGPFEGIKADSWEGGIHLPAITWWPGHIRMGQVLNMPVIAYDWASTFIDVAGAPIPERMDGVSILPSLTGKGRQQPPLIYIEYKNDENTPDYKEFAANKRGRIRGQMQVLRVGDYTGVRYNVKSAEDNFEIYNVVADPAQHQDLASIKSPSVNPSSTTPMTSRAPAINFDSLQQYMKDKVLQVRHAGNGSPRPYDSALVTPVVNNNIRKGIECRIFKGPFPWIPQTSDLFVQHSEIVPSTDLPEAAKQVNTLTEFTGYIRIPTDGEYNFYMSCDSKAFLRIHDIQVIDEDYGYPGNILRTDNVFLKAGLHPITLSYYRKEINGEAFLKLDWSGPGIKRERIPRAAFFASKN